MLKQVLEKGVKAVIILGTTGEGTTISEDERKELIKLARYTLNTQAKLIVGTGNNNFEICKRNTQMAKDFCADGVLVVTPYYNKTTQQGLIEYYTQLSQIGIPIIMYNVPSRTGLNMDTKTVEKLANNEMIYGLKEATCDINRIIELSNICKDRIALYSGEDNLNYIFYCLGGNGSISVTANICADKVQMVYDLVCEGKFKQARELQNELEEVNKSLFIETNPIPVKTLMSHMGMIEKEVRMPLVNATKESESLLLKLAEKLKQEKLTLQ